MEKQIKINKLTDEQKLLLPVYAKKWLEIGLSTKPSDKVLAEQGINKAYKVGGLKPPKKIIWCTSPLAMYLTEFVLKETLKEKRASVRDSVGDSVRASVGDSVRDSVRDSVGASVWDSVGDSVWDSVGDSVRDSVGDSVRASVYGQHDAYWLGFYDFFNQTLNLKKETKKLEGLWILALSTGWTLPLNNICFSSERHNICTLKNGNIHNDNGPAIKYPDGFAIWALNGVRVNKEIVETPAEKLDTKLIIKEKNAEVRREIVRKIGVERMCQKLNTETLDKMGDYELLKLKIPEMRQPAIYLKMRNPSIGVYHLEGVPPEITTCQEALNWRIGGKEWNPDQLT
jgi:hypothetical protein